MRCPIGTTFHLVVTGTKLPNRFRPAARTRVQIFLALFRNRRVVTELRGRYDDNRSLCGSDGIAQAAVSSRCIHTSNAALSGRPMKVEPIDVLLAPRIASAAHPWSLRRRLMFIAGAGTVAAWLVGGLVVLMAAREQSEQLHIARLEDFAHVLMRFAEHEIEEIRAERPGEIVHVETSVTLDRRLRYQVRNASGELVLVSADTAVEPFVPHRDGWPPGSRDRRSRALCVLDVERCAHAASAGDRAARSRGIRARNNRP